MQKRKNIRLREYDYSQAGYYFVTFCTKDMKQTLATVRPPDVGTDALGRPYVDLTPLGKCVDETIQIANKNNVRIDKYVIMPNHVHMIVVLDDVEDGRGRPSLQTVVGSIKSYVTKWAKQPTWQGRFHEHIIRNQASYEKIWNYIDLNPESWEKDCYFGGAS
ncbi:MAG: hypothetical protein FWB74_02335 [Defluviitaleaceae bacterium]|nr:hypothetical protein [Defluviitaleaceae bacterium]